MKLLSAAVAAIFFVLPFSEALPGTASNAWSGMVFAGLIGIVLFGQGRRPLFAGLWPLLTFLALMGFISASGAADSFRGHLMIGAQVLLFITFGPFAMRRFATLPGVLAKAVAGFLAGQSVSAGAALAQASGTVVLGWKTSNGRAPGLASHPNILGVLCGVAIVVCLYLLFKTQARKLPVLLALGANVGGLFVSGSISSLSACFVGVLVFMWAARLSIKVPIIMSVVVGAALWLVGQLADSGLLRGPAQRIAQVTGQTSDVSTLDIRQNTYAFAWESIQRDPFYGRGLDDSAGATFDNVTLTHNILLRSWFQGGLGMGLAFALIVGAIAVLIIRSLLNGQDAASAGVLAVIIAFSMTSAALQQGYFWLLILGAWALVEPKSELFRDPAGITRARLLEIERRPGAAVGSNGR